MIELYDLEQAMLKAQNLGSLKSIFTTYLHNQGINTFSFTYYLTTPGSTNKIKHDHFSKNYKQWHNHYIESGFEDIDSSFDIINQTILPLFWDVKTQIKEARSAREKQMREDSYAFGARQGLLIPINGTNKELATFVIIQMSNDRCLENWQTGQYALFVAGNLYYKYLQPFLLKIKAPKNLLTPREHQCLTLTAKQIPLTGQAKALNITPRTVNFHIQNMNKKLGVKNKHQAVMKAIQMGLIE